MPPKPFIDNDTLLDLLAEGKVVKEIAYERGCIVETVRRRIKVCVKSMGCRTAEQAVGKHVLEKKR